MRGIGRIYMQSCLPERPIPGDCSYVWMLTWNWKVMKWWQKASIWIGNATEKVDKERKKKRDPGISFKLLNVKGDVCLCCLLYGMSEVLKKKKKKALHLKHFVLSLCSVPKLTLTDVLTLNRCLLWKNVVIWFCICQTHVLTFLPVKIPEIQLWLLKLSGGQYSGSKPVTTVFLESYQHFQGGKNHAMMFFYFVRGD